MISIWYFCLQVVRDPRFESLCGNLDVEGYVSVAFLYLSVNLPSAGFMVWCSCYGFEATLCKRIESSLYGTFSLLVLCSPCCVDR